MEIGLRKNTVKIDKYNPKWKDYFLKEKLYTSINPIWMNLFKQCQYNKGYFKYTFPYYWNKPYYYTAYLKGLLYKFIYIPYEINKDYTAIIDKLRWKRKNKHNRSVQKKPFQESVL